jgi:hypothetical protein
MGVQIFGIRKSADTRKALRFFAERRVKTHFVDLEERPASPGELNRFAKKFGGQPRASSTLALGIVIPAETYAPYHHTAGMDLPFDCPPVVPFVRLDAVSTALRRSRSSRIA